MARMKSNGRFSSIVIAIASIAMISIASCGGSGEDEASDEANPSVSNLPPVAAITYSPSTVLPGDTVTLDGTTSSDPDGDDIVEYAWIQSDGTDVELSATDEAQVSFTAPAAGFLSFELVVTDSAGNQSLPAWADVPVQYDQGADDDDVAVDDDVENMTAVFASAASGSDDPSQSGSYRRPTKTIGRAIEIAGAKGLADVFVLAGTYEEAISLASGVNLKGCVASVGYDDGTISYAADNSTTVIQAPAGAKQAIDVTGADSVTVDCFTVIGGTDAVKSMGVLIKNSQGVEVTGLSVTTPGAAGSLCRDVSVEDSDGVAVSDSDFQNSGACEDYTAVNIDASNSVAIDDSAGAIEISVSPGSEHNVKGIQSTDSGSTTISGVAIACTGQLTDAAVFKGIVLGDSADAIIEGNSIAAEGTFSATGISMGCFAAAMAYAIEGNSIDLAGAAGEVTGFRINCPVPNSQIEMTRNRVRLTPDGNAAIPVGGIDATALMRPIVINAVNNIFVMPIAPIDKASKTGINLSKVGDASEVSALHNTFIMMGGQGTIHAIASDSDDLQFASSGNLMFLYSNNAQNALFRLKKSCQTNYCAKDVVANLVNTMSFSIPLNMAYYYDEAEVEDLEIVNECDLATPPAQCISGDVDHRYNVLSDDMIPNYFNMDAGELLPGHQGLAKNLGPLGTGVDVDVDGNARDDGLPDIGATEYQ